MNIKKAVYNLIICLFGCVTFCACDKIKEINYSESPMLFGAESSEAGEFLGIDIDAAEFTEEVMGGSEFKVYTTDELYTFNGNKTTVDLFFWQQEAPNGQKLGLSIIRFTFEELVDLDELAAFLEDNYKLTQKAVGSSSFSWQGNSYLELEQADKYEKVYTDLMGSKPLIPLWYLQIRQVYDKYTELTLSCPGAAVYRHIDSFDD